MIVRVDQIMEKVRVEEEIMVVVQVPLRANLLEFLCEIVTANATRDQFLVRREQSERSLALIRRVCRSKAVERMPRSPPEEILPDTGRDLTKLTADDHFQTEQTEIRSL